MAAKVGAGVGTPGWISAEKENVLQLLQQEKEEMIFPAQHEMEWLNEHMVQIFSQSQLDVTNVFKTPGKLRGKTPRTARKKPVVDARIPLSDVFSSKPLPIQSPQNNSKAPTNASKFVVASDDLDTKVSKSQTDSGYQGSSQNEIDNELKNDVPFASLATLIQSPINPSEMTKTITDLMKDDIRTTEGSFHSAKEDQTHKFSVNEGSKTHDQVARADALQQSTNRDAANKPTQLADDKQQIETHVDFDEIGSPSDESTPDRPLVRKSSLNFASLPAREPLKQSIGNRVSRTSNLDPNRQQGLNKPTQPARQLAPVTLGRDSSIMQDNGIDEDAEMYDEDDEDGNIEILGYDDSNLDLQIAKEHSKSSTQRLHEKIDMLGKAPPPRTSKSIPSAIALASAKNSEALNLNRKIEDQQRIVNDDEDDWIKPLIAQNDANHPAQVGHDFADVVERDNNDDNDEEYENDEEFDLRAPELIAHEERMKTPIRMSPSPGKSRPGYGHTKSASTATLASPAKAAMTAPPSPAKSISASYPTTTPQGSPRKYLDGTLSASKSKLQSIMKTAKGLFTSSAGVSAAAKLETLSPHALRIATNTMPGMYPSVGSMLEDKPLPKSPRREGRQSRSSTEKEKEEKRKEKEVKAMQKMENQLEKAREQEKQKAIHQKQNQEKATIVKSSQRPEISPKRIVDDKHIQNQADIQIPATQEAPSKPVRPIKPARDAGPKAKPAPVAIRVGTLSQRMPMNTSSLASSTQDTLPGEPKRPGLSKQPSTASIQSSANSATTFKSSVNAHPTKPRALLAAERKKEQDEREAQRKLEQRREMEKKRAAQQEDARRQEQKQRTEAERKERERLVAEQAKRQAQQQAIERKRQQNARKAEEQRHERAAAEENSSARPPSRLGNQPVARSLINHPLPTNPAKPAKRPLEEESNVARPQASKYGAASQQSDSKRRRTDDESVVEAAPRPTISGAPVRQSNLGKKPSIFNYSSYAPAPQPTHMNQLPPPPNRTIPQMSQFANGAKIPFAEAPNPPAQTKTPASAYQQKTIQAVKSSPQYPNGDAIHLPEIPTDSEDEDSEDDGNAFPIPDWATPGHLTDQLMRQEGMDGDAVFGPIAPLKMEEIFAKTNKDRLKRLRDRTSSANWALSGDGLTLEEVKADREQRERMRIEGGWRYGS